jgi:hypothetical protein
LETPYIGQAIIQLPLLLTGRQYGIILWGQKGLTRGTTWAMSFSGKANLR